MYGRRSGILRSDEKPPAQHPAGNEKDASPPRRHNGQGRGEGHANSGVQRWGEPVDYIIFGIGAGSSLVLIGWLLRDWGPALRDRTSRASNDVLTAQQLIAIGLT